MATEPVGNSGLLDITGPESFPLSQILSGTVTATTTSNAVVGVGTSFITQIGYNGNDLTIPVIGNIGYLWDITNNQWRKIDKVVSNTLIQLKQPFSNNLSGATVKYIPQSRVRELYYTDISGSGGGSVDNVTLAANEGGGWRLVNFGDPPITPHLFNGTSGNIHITYSFV